MVSSIPIESQIHRIMAIVNRSKRELQLCNSKQLSLGPGAYSVEYGLITPKAVVARIFPEHFFKPKPTPPPTNNPFTPQQPTFFVDKENTAPATEDDIFSSKRKMKGLLERCQTKRTELKTVSTAPGPGSYKVEKDIIKPSQKYDGPKLHRSHILEDIFKIPYYQNVMAGPDLEQFETQLAVPRKETHPSEQAIAPKKPGYTISKNQRFKMSKETLLNNPGPGTYNLAQNLSPKEANKRPKHNYADFIDKQISRITQDTTHNDDSEEDSMEYIKESVPGPGSYQLSTSKPSFSKSVQKFGSTSKRFVQQKVVSTAQFADQHIKPVKVSRKKDVVFGRSQSSVTIRRSEEVYDLGPGTYDDPQSIEYIHNKELSRHQQSNFGSNSIRFRPVKAQYENRKDFYISPIKEDFFDNDEEPLETCVFRSRTPQGDSYLAHKDFVSEKYYCQDYHTISKKLQSDSVKSTEQVVLQPPFNSGVVRFKYEVKEEEDDDEEECYQFEGEFQRNEYENGRTFSKAVTEPKKNTNPGPGSYNSNNAWNSASHNILFMS